MLPASLQYVALPPKSPKNGFLTTYKYLQGMLNIPAFSILYVPAFIWLNSGCIFNQITDQNEDTGSEANCVINTFVLHLGNSIKTRRTPFSSTESSCCKLSEPHSVIANTDAATVVLKIRIILGQRRQRALQAPNNAMIHIWHHLFLLPGQSHQSISNPNLICI